MTKIILVSVATCFLLLGCSPEKELPFLGQHTQDDQGNKILHQVADFSFTDQNAKPFSSEKRDAGIVVMNYFFTSCPTICPKMTDNLATVFDAFQGDDEVTFVSASVDPTRDDPARLTLFMNSHKIPLDKNWHFLTGEKKDLYRFARYEIFLSAMDEDVEVEDDFIHSEKVVLIDKDRYIRGYYTGTDVEDMKQLKQDIKSLK